MTKNVHSVQFDGSFKQLIVERLRWMFRIKKIESNKGKPVIVDGHKFRQAFLKMSGEICWHCTVKDCATKVTADASCQAVLR